MLLPETDAHGGGDRGRAAGRGGPRTPGARSPRAPRRIAGADRGDASRSASPSIPDHGSTGAAVLDAADDALYAAKNAGRDTYRLAEPSPLTRSPLAAGTVRAMPRGSTAGDAGGGRQPPRQAAADSLAACPEHSANLAATPTANAHASAAGGQGRHPGGRTGHPVPAGHQGGAQGAAAGRRPAGAAVHRRGGGRGRHQRRAAGHRPGQDLHGGPLRPPPGPGGPAGGEGRRRAAGRGHAAPASWPRSTPAGRASRSASATRSAYAESHVGDEPVRGAARRRVRRAPSRCCRRCSTCRPAPAASCWRSSRSTRRRPTRYGIASVEPAEPTDRRRRGRRGDRPGGEAASRRRRRATSPCSAGTCCPATIFDAIRRTKPGSGGEIQLTDAMALLLAEGTPVHGDRLPRAPGTTPACRWATCRRSCSSPSSATTSAPAFRAVAGRVRQHGRYAAQGGRSATDMTATADAEAAANELTPLADYLGSVLRRLRALPPLDLDLTQAYGNVLAEDVRRAAPVPRLRPGRDRRVRRPLGGPRAAGRIGPACPRRAGRPAVRLNVVGDLGAASWRPVRLTPGTCFSVAAGAPLPIGADVVVPVHWTDQGMAAVEITASPKRGYGVRRAGEELPAGRRPGPRRRVRHPGHGGGARRHRHRARRGPAQPAGRRRGHRRRTRRRGPGQPARPGGGRQLARAHRRRRRGGRATRTGSASATTTRRGCAACWRTRRCGPT